MDKEIELIRRFRVTSKYKGYFWLIEAVRIARENYSKGLHVTKDIYPELAHRHGVPRERIERNMRTVVEKCWENNSEFLQEMAGYQLDYCPTISEFLDIAAYWLNVEK